MPETIPVCVGRAGCALRFTIGSDRLPELSVAAPGAPAWGEAGTASLTLQGGRFTLDDAGERILSGSGTHDPYHLDIQVGEARILGFGAAIPAGIGKRLQFRVMTRDTLLYGIPGASYTAFPFFIAREHSRATGVLVATTYPLDVVIAGGVVSLTGACDTRGTPIDVIVFRGSMVEILRDLASIVGRSFLPPSWALGFHQSRWSYRSSEEVLRIARKFRALGLPADAIHLDIHYMDRYRVFTFDARRFPQPRGMHDALRAIGFRTLAIVDPGVSVARYPIFTELESGDMLLKRSDDRPYVGRVWPGHAVFPDFTQQRVRAAWGRFHQPLVDAGVGGIWNDMNDPVFRMGEDRDPLREDVFHHGTPHCKVRNIYANCMAEATFSGLESLRPGQRPFVLSRSGFMGIQRHAAVWTGDNHSTWEHLRQNLQMVIGLGLSGAPITGADVGGFGRAAGKYGVVKFRRPSAELFVRWMELGSMMPFFRVHTTLFSPRQEPWSFGRRALDLSRSILRRRYRLLPLFYRLALEAHREGLPIVRPVSMHYEVPDGEADEQFLLGETVLVAPVLHRGATRRQLCLPSGRWVDWYTGRLFEGGRITVDAPLGTIPIFVRAGMALFLAEPGINAGQTLRGQLALEVMPPLSGDVGRGSLFLDDGESIAGGRYVLDVTVEGGPENFRVVFAQEDRSFEPPQRDVEIRVPPSFRSVMVDGERRALALQARVEEGRRVGHRVARVSLTTHELFLGQGRD